MSESTQAQANVNSPGKMLLLVISVIFIAFGALGISFAIMGLTGTATIITMLGAWAAFEIIYNVISLAISLIMLIVGILGIKKCKYPEKSKFFINWGIIIGTVSLIPMVLSFTGVVSWISIVDVILGALYIVGGVMNKKALAHG